MVIVGIVGGVASGKSFVSQRLEALGGRLIDADRLGHDVLKDPQVKAALVSRWGDAIVDDQGDIDRKAVAGLVFAAPPQGPQELAFLEATTHPRIAERIAQAIDQRAQQNVSVVVLDAAVLLKAGWDRFCNRILFVDVPRQLRLERALARGWDQNEFATREAAQEPLASKRAEADWVIDNGGSPEQTFAHIQEFWQTLGADSSTPNR